MDAPSNGKHKPIVSIDNYDSHDGIYKGMPTDAKALSVGESQWDTSVISAKVFRHSGKQWKRQSEELPLHRIMDLNTLILKSILESADIRYPATKLGHVIVKDKSKLPLLVDYYKNNRVSLLPKLQELQIVLNYFLQEEPKL